MKRYVQAAGWTIVAVLLFGMTGMAQDVEPPFTWKGKGEATVMGEYGTNDIDFELKLSIDAEGAFKGQTSNEDGSSAIKHVFYSMKTDYEMPGLYSRKVIIVILINEDGDNPMLAVMNGRILSDKFFYGEVSLHRYEAEGDVAKGLAVDSVVATEIEEDYLPSSLKSALKKCTPFGTFKVEGDYTE